LKNSPFKKVLLVVLLLATGIALLLKFGPSAAKKRPASVPLDTSKSDFRYHYAPPPIHPSTDQSEPESNPIEQPRISRENAEAWLAKHNRSAMSLLAAFRANGDTNYLIEAAANFPDDPRVELAVLSRNAFPEERRKWLDLFKASSPSNSLANYFSAQDHFKNGKTDEAVQELLAASGKARFDNHAMETQLDAEELYLDSGKTPHEAIVAAMSDMSAESLPELATLKGVAGGIRDLMQQKSGAGDADSVVNLAQMGLGIADKLNSGDSGKYLINQLVSMATETIALSQLNQNTAYDFLGGQTPAQILEQHKQEKVAFRELLRNYEAVSVQLTESETVNYYRHAQIYGEIEAMKWAIRRRP
jgi:hypothetical protein